MRYLKKLPAVFVLSVSCSAAFAGQVTFQGTLADLGSGWRTSSIPKTLDADGDNILGTDGWILPDGTASLPTYLNTTTVNSSYYAGNALYASIDNPVTTPGINPTTMGSKTWNPFVGSNPVNLVSFVLNDSATFRVGLMIDNLDNSIYNPSSVFITQDANPSASASYTLTGVNNNGIPDWIFFDVTGTQGDSFNIGAVGGTNGAATLGAVSFDATNTPEPSTAFLIAATLIALGMTRCSKRGRVKGLLSE